MPTMSVVNLSIKKYRDSIVDIHDFTWMVASMKEQKENTEYIEF